jgi:hypothetical protein
VAHKTGWNDDLYHEFGMVFVEGRQPYVLAIMTHGFEQQSHAHACVAEISKSVYDTLK